MEFGQGPRSGARDNGLRCASYVAVGDLDPRVADSLLETLREEGIAAYVTPSTTPRGGYLESPPPAGLTDRLFADAEHVARARELLPAAEPPPDADIDFDSAWQQVLQSLQTPSDDAVPRWPVSEDVDAETTSVPVELPIGGSLGYDDAEPADDPNDHFVPPPPPPLPRLHRVTIVCLLAIAGGLFVLITGVEGGVLFWPGIVAIAGGVGGLVWHMKDGPPIDSGWDDGAVV
jgi:hypothetical protein